MQPVEIENLSTSNTEAGLKDIQLKQVHCICDSLFYWKRKPKYTSVDTHSQVKKQWIFNKLFLI